MKVLIYPAGTEIGLEIFRALKWQKDIEVIGGTSTLDHSFQVYDDLVKIPDIYEHPEEAIKSLKEQDVDFIYPAHDQVVYELTKSGMTNVIAPSYRTAAICRSKSATYKALRPLLKCPAMIDPSWEINFPVFLKPDKGQGSKGTMKIENMKELNFHYKDQSILEYLPGKEYTIDCFTDRKGFLRYTLARERQRTNNGISIKSEVACIPTDMAEVISRELEMRGAWFYQVKEKNGQLYLMEVAARPSGTSCLARMRGVNLPLLSLWDKMGNDIVITENEFPVTVTRALEGKYHVLPAFNNVYIDLDDTLNYMTIALLYKFRAMGKNIFLLTRHEQRWGQPVEKALAEMRVSEQLFDGIIKVEGGKGDHIIGSSILIDDSFSERQSVRCFAFDVQQAIELFL